ncbi:PREDICTED: dnaJ homolog subfamily B member 1-like [Erythranthe guttata]|nr:PREDICTED: dnaJ homolog subfamily B member 1-like [Erythranthe guttata]|eukprot:XP_012850146.1 PREDICTED: dnaJ homolog subfamily B member 1-like [Erythranthe guttata]
MGDHSKSPTSNFYGILGIQKTASLSDVCKAYKSLVMKWHPDRNPSNKAEAQDKFTSINEAYRALSIKKREEDNACNGDHETKTPKKKKKEEKNDDNEIEMQISKPILISRTTSRTSPLPSPTFSSSSSRRSTTPIPMDFYTSFPVTSSGGNTPTTPSTPKDPASLSKVGSRRSTTPIFFSQSAVRIFLNDRLIVEEEEILMIKIKPGWKKGTKITFEGKGDERPGTLPADIIFSIDEKRHPLFKREGDDLELGVEVPLVQALTGCTVPVPLLGGGQITLSIEDIIYPGYEKIIPGQGMPVSKEGKRGDLRLKFLVEFPAELSDEQRSEVVSILEGCS